MSSQGAAFERLEWDSEKFGFGVARIESNLPIEALMAAAAALRAAGVQLAYYNVDIDREPLSSSLLASIGGRLVDTRLTYRKELHERPDPVSVPDSAGVQIAEYAQSAADPVLIDLSRESGRYSRFRVDTRIDRRVFESIYDAWIRRSVAREIADTVLVARSGVEPVGLVTLRVVDHTATIGLLSVSVQSRGAGLGRALLRAAANWSADRGAIGVFVATQAANRAACGLYESMGYAMAQAERVYHLWLG